jgi:hypothetical protein
MQVWVMFILATLAITPDILGLIAAIDEFN